MNKNLMNKNLILLIIVLITSVMIYFVFSKSNIGIIDTSHYEKTIDSLNSVVHQHDVKIDSLNKSINERTAKIIEYNNQLSDLKNKLNKEKKAHETDINRINSLSNRDISSEFANAFK
jgi:uncharacterized coiled-coil protein SlyX